MLDPLLAAALAAVRDKGYHGDTVREIAERAGLSLPRGPLSPQDIATHYVRFTRDLMGAAA